MDDIGDEEYIGNMGRLTSLDNEDNTFLCHNFLIISSFSLITNRTYTNLDQLQDYLGLGGYYVDTITHLNSIGGGTFYNKLYSFVYLGMTQFQYSIDEQQMQQCQVLLQFSWVLATTLHLQSEELSEKHCDDITVFFVVVVFCQDVILDY